MSTIAYILAILIMALGALIVAIVKAVQASEQGNDELSRVHRYNAYVYALVIIYDIAAGLHYCRERARQPEDANRDGIRV